MNDITVFFLNSQLNHNKKCQKSHILFIQKVGLFLWSIAWNTECGFSFFFKLVSINIIIITNMHSSTSPCFKIVYSRPTFEVMLGSYARMRFGAFPVMLDS